MPSDTPRVVPFSLKDAPALIERLFPAQKLSAEAQKERKSGAGQILTALGTYWKGRKPLILVRGCVLGALLPATDAPEKDLAVFEKLMGIDDDAFQHRVKRKPLWPDILSKSYIERVYECLRPEELPDSIYSDIWPEVNEHLGTSADSFAGLVEQLGIMRFGRRPTVADAFAGGGAIPYEAARLGCNVVASDLNPVACMLTWSALNIIGNKGFDRERWGEELHRAIAAVDEDLERLGIEADSQGNRAKAYLYCLEVRCPKTGWMVPLSPTWVVSRTSRTVVILHPSPEARRFEFSVRSNATAEQMLEAERGTVRDGNLFYELDGEQYVTPIKTIRGDRKGDSGGRSNALRPWTLEDVAPRPEDTFQERLYCIQWIRRDCLGSRRPETFYSSPTTEDLDRERHVQDLVRTNLVRWQKEGLVPDLQIEPGDKTDEPIRTRGWTYWHHLFAPRQLLVLSLLSARLKKTPEGCITLATCLNYMSKLCRINPRTEGSGREMCLADVFYNQALNPMDNYGVRSLAYFPDNAGSFPHGHVASREVSVSTGDATSLRVAGDIVITDPPYADAVKYEELSDYFIAWLRKNPPEPFASWTWDSRRALAIRGEGEEFRQKMVEAYSAMTRHMPDNGLQIVMFTHQSGEVWADMAQIFWGAGLQVMAAWYIATETTSELKKGGYVQGTVILVLRKRKADEAGYKDEIVQEIKDEVALQIDTMVGLNQSLKGHGRIENLFEDADLQMAGYAAALRVLTGYARIDGTDMTREALRPRKKGERSLVTDIIEFAVQVANEHLVPEGMDARVWERLTGSERFYLKMLDIETTGARKLDNYQNFAKAFRVPDYTEMMDSLKPNDARLRSAVRFKKGWFGETEFGTSPTRAALYALYELQDDVDGDTVLSHLRDLVDGYLQKREALIAVASYVALKRQEVDPEEAKAARILHGLIRNERLGG